MNFFTPAAGNGPWPGVILCFDGAGMRPAIDQIAQRIAALGYVVAVPDLFHRAGSVLDALPAGVPRETASFFTLLGDA